MRCGCPVCGRWMIQSDSNPPACVCPECGTRCSACMGTNSVMSREALQELGKMENSFLYAAFGGEEEETEPQSTGFGFGRDVVQIPENMREREETPYPINRNFYRESSFAEKKKPAKPQKKGT